jgi:hypothetical protein
LAHFGTADVANECPIIERKQTSAVTFGPAKTDHFGEPVQLQLWVRIFCLQSRRRALAGQRHGRFTNCAMME